MLLLVESEQLEWLLADPQHPVRQEASVLAEEPVIAAFVIVHVAETIADHEATRSSDLDGEPGSMFTVGTLWGPSFNPWSGAALHEAGLMNPAVTTTWWGASQGAACMGTSGSRAFTGQAFYSVPGPGASSVPIAENTGELPFPPQEAVGLGDEPYLAPTILLWDEDSAAVLVSARLATAAGATVPVSLVTPATPTPQSPSSFPAVTTFGGYTEASFVVPRVKFMKDTSYVLTATWQGLGGTTTQTIPFKTAATDLNGLIAAYEASAKTPGVTSAASLGTVTPALQGHRLTIKATGAAVGQTVRIQIERCPSRRCSPREVQVPWRRTVRLRSATTTVIVPSLARGFRSVLTLYLKGFTIDGHRVDSEVTGTTLR